MIKAGVIGWPIQHSKSPIIHGHWLKQFKISGQYMKIPIAPADLDDGLRALIDEGYTGANVTLPHKEAVLAISDTSTERAQVIGAANTLIFRKGEIHADNTDCEGFVNNLKMSASDWNAGSGPALILGAGGAARGVVFGLLEAGVPEVFIANRTRAKADELASLFGASVIAMDWSDISAALGHVALLVNTSSLGMTGQPDLDLDLGHLQKTTLVTDIVYTPLETKLLKTAKQMGCQTVDGLGMLLHQAVPGFEAWFGPRPIVDDTLRQKVLFG